jgi:hypothetical protein
MVKIENNKISLRYISFLHKNKMNGTKKRAQPGSSEGQVPKAHRIRLRLLNRIHMLYKNRIK